MRRVQRSGILQSELDACARLEERCRAEVSASAHPGSVKSNSSGHLAGCQNLHFLAQHHPQTKQTKWKHSSNTRWYVTVCSS